MIPVLLIRNGGLVKTRGFRDDKYVGDPINAVRIFNEKAVDEIAVFDIDASEQEREPNFALIAKLANECRMPLCYGGGIKNLATAERIISLGVEKVAMSSAAIEHPELIAETAKSLGRQSVVAVLDVKKSAFRGYEVYTHNATKKVKKNLLELVEELQQLGVGEIVINSIDRDGMMKGYDISLADQVKKHCKVPLTILGGAGSLEDVGELIATCGTLGCAAGSYFVFKGKYRAVLISYPSLSEKLRTYGMQTP